MVRGKLREDINYYLISMGFLAASFLALLLPNFPIWAGFFIMSIGVKRISCGEAGEKLQARVLFLTYALSFWALVVFLAPYLRITFNPVITRILWVVTQAAQLYLVRQLVTWYAWLLEDKGRSAQAAQYRKNLNYYTIIFCIAVLGTLLANITGGRSIILLCLLSFFISGIWMVMMLNRMPGLLAMAPAAPGNTPEVGAGNEAAAGTQYENQAESEAEMEYGADAGYGIEADAGYEIDAEIDTEYEDGYGGAIADAEAGEAWEEDSDKAWPEQGQRKRGAVLDDGQDE